MMKQAVSSVTVIVAFLLAGCVTIRDYEAVTFAVGGENAVMTGVIDHTISERVERLRREHPEVKTIVMADVPGSIDDEATLVAARPVRDYGWNTTVPSDGAIASGGVDFFLAGVERTIEEDAQLGVHTWAADGGGSAAAPTYPATTPSTGDTSITTPRWVSRRPSTGSHWTPRPPVRFTT